MYVRPRHAGAHGYRRKVAKYSELIKDEEAKLGGVLRGGSDTTGAVQGMVPEANDGARFVRSWESGRGTLRIEE